VTAEDSGNYTCQIDGPQNTVISKVTHSLIVNGMSSVQPVYTAMHGDQPVDTLHRLDVIVIQL